MARKPSNPFGQWPLKPKRAAKPRNPFAPPKASETPAPRNHGFERTLCEAIKARLIVELRYDDDVLPRTFAADVIYPTGTGKMCVAGRMPQPFGEWKPRTLEVGKIRSLSVTDRPFTTDPRFNLFDPKYRDRICPL